jgi:ATP-dependent Clp protease ATP-binding subunit ClpA
LRAIRSALLNNGREMFERFTVGAKRVVSLSQEEARMFNHDTIRTEHILLGLIREGAGVAAKALQAMNISLDAGRQEVEKIVGRGQVAPTKNLPFTSPAKRVLELSLREALELGHNYIGTEHILLGLIRDGEGLAVQVLKNLGADLEDTRRIVLALLVGAPPAPPEAILNDRLRAFTTDGALNAEGLLVGQDWVNAILKAAPRQEEGRVLLRNVHFGRTVFNEFVTFSGVGLGGDAGL